MTDPVKTSNLGVTPSLSANDRIVVLTNPATSAQTQTISFSSFVNSIANAQLGTISPSTSNGVMGQVSIDSSYIYVCTANNVWKRAALTSY